MGFVRADIEAAMLILQSNETDNIMDYLLNNPNIDDFAPNPFEGITHTDTNLVPQEGVNFPIVEDGSISVSEEVLGPNSLGDEGLNVRSQVRDSLSVLVGDISMVERDVREESTTLLTDITLAEVGAIDVEVEVEGDVSTSLLGLVNSRSINIDNALSSLSMDSRQTHPPPSNVNVEVDVDVEVDVEVDLDGEEAAMENIGDAFDNISSYANRIRSLDSGLDVEITNISRDGEGGEDGDGDGDRDRDGDDEWEGNGLEDGLEYSIFDTNFGSRSSLHFDTDTVMDTTTIENNEDELHILLHRGEISPLISYPPRPDVPLSTMAEMCRSIGPGTGPRTMLPDDHPFVLNFRSGIESDPSWQGRESRLDVSFPTPHDVTERQAQVNWKFYTLFFLSFTFLSFPFIPPFSLFLFFFPFSLFSPLLSLFFSFFLSSLPPLALSPFLFSVFV